MRKVKSEIWLAAFFMDDKKDERPVDASFNTAEHAHRRFNPLTNSWVLCSPHRTSRPWHGQEEDASSDELPVHDPKCFLCPGNSRAGVALRNPKYETTFVFPNDFPAVKENQPDFDGQVGHPLLRVQAVRGQCHVICFSPAHNLTVAEMSVNQITSVVEAWTETYRNLSVLPYVGYVQIFENKGAVMGCSNPHPHGQVWAIGSVPEEAGKEISSLRRYRNANASCLLCDYAQLEFEKAQSSSDHRLVCYNEHFICVVPFWAVWPYETLVLPHKRHIPDLLDMEHQEKAALADILRRIACRYDDLFKCSFPYSMGLHQRPATAAPEELRDVEDSHLHIHFYPPLLRSRMVKKFLVGFEMMGEPQRDLTPEQAAQRLRECSESHYKHVKCSSSQ